DLRRSLEHLRAGSPRFTLPQIRLPRGRAAIYIAAGIIVFMAVVGLLGRLANSDNAALPPNAIWIGTEWTHQERQSDEIEALVQRLRENQIGTVYAWVSWLQEDGTWRAAEKFGFVREFVTQFKALYPEARLLGWVSFPVQVGASDYRLDDAELQQNIADFCGRVISDLGYDGIFLNVEPVWNGDDEFLSLLRKVRVEIGTDTPLAVAIPPDWSPLDADVPVPPLIVPGTVWDEDYKQKVALLSDQMAVMAYNSGMSTQEDYTEWVAYQVRIFAEAVAGLGGGTQIIIGIPTYDSEPPGHDTAVENIPAALRGVKAGLTAAGTSAALVQGVAIYADWTTDAAEWEQYTNNWLD
ncbi:MAG: hypothetical protein K8I30_03455, partial [Anaerolineae bacterium]|nr:hypothetical protein [Anaerolineae bacterium]